MKLNKRNKNLFVKEFPLLEEIKFQIHTTTVPVNFTVKKILEQHINFDLEYGRYNNNPDSSYTDGTELVFIWDKGHNMRIEELSEGCTNVADIVTDDDVMLLAYYCYRSMLVYDDPGYREYTLYKNIDHDGIQKTSEKEVFEEIYSVKEKTN